MAGAVFLAALAPAVAQQMPGAIGRLSYQDQPPPGKAICTGTLIAPDLVLTAGHCLPDDVADHPETLWFKAGLAGDTALATRHGAQVIRPPLAPGSPPDTPPPDLAFLRLDRPVTEVAPLSLSLDAFPDETRLFGYDRDTPTDPPRPETCRFLDGDRLTPTARVVLECLAVSGNSGAPLLVRQGDGWAVAGVAVASGRVRGYLRPITIAVIPPAAPR